MHQHLLPSMPDYQLKIPRSLQLLILIGVMGGILGIFLLSEAQTLLAALLLISAVVIGLIGVTLLIVTNPRGRERARQQMIDSVAWNGSEQILDVGCGNGIVLLSAAQHLTPGKGKALGIDIWVEGSGDQSAQTLRKNAALEGVADRVEFQSVDARKMPYSDASFDVIFASLSLHHMGDSADRQQAAREMLRVLKPGGVILIYDILPIAVGAAHTLLGLGASEAHGLSGIFMRTVRIQKPR